MPNPIQERDKLIPLEEKEQIKPAQEANQASVQAGEDAAAAAALERVLEGTEAREPKDIKDIRYFHVDDDKLQLRGAQRDLQEFLGMEKRLGTAQSVEQAVERITQLAEKGQEIDLLILDQQFPLVYDDSAAFQDNVPNGSEQLLLKLVQLIQESEKVRKALERTKVVSLSGTADPEYVDKLREIFPGVIGRIPKGSQFGTAAELASILVTQKVVAESAELTAMVEPILTEKKEAALIEKLNAEYGRPAIRREARKPADTNMLETVNGFRTQNGLEPYSGLDDTEYKRFLSRAGESY